MPGGIVPDCARFDASLAMIARSNSAVGGLVEWSAFGPDVRHPELEALGPEPP